MFLIVFLYWICFLNSLQSALKKWNIINSACNSINYLYFANLNSINLILPILGLFMFWVMLVCIFSEELEQHGNYFVNLAITLLSAYKVFNTFRWKKYLVWESKLWLSLTAIPSLSFSCILLGIFVLFCRKSWALPLAVLENL